MHIGIAVPQCLAQVVQHYIITNSHVDFVPFNCLGIYAVNRSLDKRYYYAVLISNGLEPLRHVTVATLFFGITWVVLHCAKDVC